MQCVKHHEFGLFAAKSFLTMGATLPGYMQDCGDSLSEVDERLFYAKVGQGGCPH